MKNSTSQRSKNRILLTKPSLEQMEMVRIINRPIEFLKRANPLKKSLLPIKIAFIVLFYNWQQNCTYNKHTSKFLYHFLYTLHFLTLGSQWTKSTTYLFLWTISTRKKNRLGQHRIVKFFRFSLQKTAKIWSFFLIKNSMTNETSVWLKKI